MNRFIIDPARAYSYFSTAPSCLYDYRRLIWLSCLVRKQFFPKMHIREELQDEGLKQDEVSDGLGCLVHMRYLRPKKA